MLLPHCITTPLISQQPSQILIQLGDGTIWYWEWLGVIGAVQRVRRRSEHTRCWPAFSCFSLFFRLVEFNGRPYLKWSSAYKQRLAIWRRLHTWQFYSAAALLSIVVCRPRGFKHGFQTRWSDDRRKTHRRGRRLAYIYTSRGQKNTRRRRTAEAVVVVVLDSCQHTHGLKTHGGGLFAATTREAGREGSPTFRRAWNYERVHARVCVCVVKVDKELMVNRGEGDEGSSSPYFTVSCKTRTYAAWPVCIKGSK